MSNKKSVKPEAYEYINNLSKHTDDNETLALINCLMAKVNQQATLIKNIIGETELAEQPKEVSAEVSLNSIKSMIESESNMTVIEAVGGYSWEFKD